ncbi:MAG: acyl-CoA/acyl-ACP dehydrogenase [Chloroflexi bacterium]|nr:acyl-CoA/acyl-ACP dehydrogenase [Chloroflexota bacterium]MDA1241094.1 acyl-CoA/acyl-ACP dehydrogenase [Chloroflexota bacterium]
MDLGLTETQELLKNAAREFLENECPEQHVRDMEEDEKGYSPVLWQQMAEQGWQGLLIPEAHGGAGFDFLDLSVLLEEFGRALVPGPFMSTVLGGAVPLMEIGSDAQQAEFLPKIASGDLIFTLALTEPSARFDESGVQAKATVSGNEVTFDGTKLFVSDANVADYMIVAGRSAKGVTLGIVATQQAGVTINQLQTIARDKQCEVVLKGAKGQLLGTDGGGWAALQPVLQKYTVAECAYMVGLSQMDFEIAVDYAKERVQFGRPIGSFQAIQHKCADMVTDVDGSRFIMYKAAWAISSGQPAADTQIAVNMAKAWCSEATRRVVAHGQQIHGGIGFTKDYKIQLFFRRQKRAELAFGDSDFHREAVAQQLGL